LAPFVCDRAIDLPEAGASINDTGHGRGYQDQRRRFGRILDQWLRGAAR
jgi:hypothetical protein